MCGIIGISGKSDISPMLISGLTTLQHRGQDAAGIAVLSDQFYIKKGKGLVKEVFKENTAQEFSGSLGIGHVRYTTRGTNSAQNAQPLVTDKPVSIAMAHNGNITNIKELEHYITAQGDIVTTNGDSELLMRMFSIALRRQELDCAQEALFNAVNFVHENAIGAYAIVAVVKNAGLLGFTDSNGIRPLLLGKKETPSGPTYCFSSESNTFNVLGFETIHRLTAGQIAFVDLEGRLHLSEGRKTHFNPCIFEDIYFSNVNSQAIEVPHKDVSIAQKRKQIGRILAKHFIARNLMPDVIIDVPNSAYFYAAGLAEALKVPHLNGIQRNHLLRTFITADKDRAAVVRKKFSIAVPVVANKKVAVVDDSIVRGTVSKQIVSQLKAAGAKEIYFVSGSPMVTNPCIYGIDMSSKEELIAYQRTEAEIASFMGADHVVYPQLTDLAPLYKNCKFCDACFSGQYPTQPCDKTLAAIAKEKQKRITVVRRVAEPA